MRWLRGLIIAIGVLVLLITGFAAQTWWGKPWSLDHFYMRYLVRTILPYPTLLTSTGLLKPTGLTFYEDDLNDVSMAALERQTAYQESELEVLRSYDRESLEPQDQLSYDVMQFWLEAGMLRIPPEFFLHDYAIEHLSAPHVSMVGFLVEQHPFDDPRSAEWYVSRVSKLATVVDQEIATARVQAERGIIAPRFILERTRRDCLTFTSSAAADHPLVFHFDEKTGGLDGLSPQERDEQRERLVRVIDESVYPAWTRLVAVIDELLPKSTNDAGVWKLPDGEDYYAYKLFQNTTTKMTAEQIHELGQQKVAELSAEMGAILEAEGYDTARPVGEVLRSLVDEPRFRYDTSEAGREAVLEEYQRIIDEIDAGMAELFDLSPPVGVVVEPVAEFLEDSAPGGSYNAPPMDFSRPGTFMVNLGALDEESRIMMRTLAYHEAVPGHHFQIAIARSLEDLPMARRMLPFIAYIEGWALYAERLAAESGYQEDPFDRLGYLNAQMHRAVRLVVDTGLHHLRWPRQKALDFMLEKSGLGQTEAEIEIDRYVVWPGQATAYMTGQLAILELRERLKKKRGDAFDIKEFHNRVLGNGALPLFLLERVVLAD